MKPQYVCECGEVKFEVFSNDYELELVCTRCQKTIVEREDEK